MLHIVQCQSGSLGFFCWVLDQPEYHERAGKDYGNDPQNDKDPTEINYKRVQNFARWRLCDFISIYVPMRYILKYKNTISEILLTDQYSENLKL